MWDWLQKLAELRAAGLPHAIVTVIHAAGSTPRETGTRMIVLESGEFFGTIGGGNLERQAIAEAVTHLRHSGRAASDKVFARKYTLCEKSAQCCGGVVEVLVEAMGLEPELYVFGAGHVGQAIAETLRGTPFRVHLIDERKEWIGSAAIPASVHRHQGPWQEELERIPWSAARSYAVVLTHSHDLDAEILLLLARKPLRYLGLIGSRSKWSRFRPRLLKGGLNEEELEKIECPIGLPLGGGKAPKEIAISLGARLLQLFYGEACA